MVICLIVVFWLFLRKLVEIVALQELKKPLSAQPWWDHIQSGVFRSGLPSIREIQSSWSEFSEGPLRCRRDELMSFKVRLRALRFVLRRLGEYLISVYKCMMEPESFQWCSLTGQEVGTN